LFALKQLPVVCVKYFISSAGHTVSCFSKIQIGFTCLVPAHPGSPGQWAVKWVRACVCDCVSTGHTMQLLLMHYIMLVCKVTL